MTRSGLLQLTIVILLICASIMGLLWWYIQKADLQLNQLNGTLEGKKTELANLAQMTEAQDKLDKLTLDERETTQLALLRHLALEDTPLDFQVLGREARPSGDTTLIIRSISLQINKSYTDQMALLDQLYRNGKLHINKVTMTRAELLDVMDPVSMVIEGVMYSLEKMSVAEPNDANTAAGEQPSGSEGSMPDIHTPQEGAVQ